MLCIVQKCYTLSIICAPNQLAIKLAIELCGVSYMSCVTRSMSHLRDGSYRGAVSWRRVKHVGVVHHGDMAGTLCGLGWNSVVCSGAVFTVGPPWHGRIQGRIG
jgi:hypothetical protein